MHIRTLIVLSLFGILFFPGSAHAYIDPGTGSLILQIVFATIASSLVVIKMYWLRIKNFFKKGKSEQTAPDDEERDPGEKDLP